ncbi:MAG TPA: FAD-binding oxidoreductase [Sphingomicrobium sp.]
MTPDQTQLIAAVRDRFGPRAVVTEPADVEPWLTDWRGKFHGQAAGILSPASTAEVAAMVALAAHHRVPLVPQGGNTSMVGGATPPSDGSALILSLRRMNALRSIDPGANVAVAEAGMILADLHDRAAEVGRRFPLTLGARGSCTIGGLIATNAGGTQVLRFGTMRALVAGIEAVLSDGTVHDGLTALKKDNRGYSLDHLLIGSEGTLGIVTAASLKLVAAVAGRAVAWVGLRDPHAALELLQRLQAQTDMVEGFEIVPDDALTLVLEHIPGTRPPLAGQHDWHVLIEATSADGARPPAAELERLLAEALAQKLIADAVIAASETQADAFWRIRDSISEAERAAGGSLAHDISVPVADMPRFMLAAATEVERAFPGAKASAFGHLGDGNVHFHVRAKDHDPASITALVHDLVTAAGGSISAEHGIGQMKRAEFERLAPPGRIAVLTAIKHALDPLGLMNPGKLLG